MPARNLVLVVPFNCVALLVMVIEIFLPGSVANTAGALTNTAHCLPFVLAHVTKLVFEFLIGVVGASFALMCV